MEKEIKQNEKKEKKKRSSVKEHIKTAKKNKEVPMTFWGTKDDDTLKPKRNLQRTPPRANKASPAKDDIPVMGGGMISRDDEEPRPKVQSKIKRSPPRKYENKVADNTAKKANRNYDYLDDIKIESAKIERKDKISRSPVDSMRNIDFLESPVKLSRVSEKHESAPLNINPFKAGNEFVQPQYYYDDNMYQDNSPQKPFYGSPKTHKVGHGHEELTSFEDRVDGLLCETRNILDDFTPKTEGATAKHDLNFHKAVSYTGQEGIPQYFGGDMQMSATNPGVMAGMMPNMIPQPVYRQNSYPATYYAPIPMNQGIMQPQPYYAPYPQEMMGGAMQSPYPGQSQMIPTNMVNSNGQPIYQVIYTTAATSPPLGQFNSPY